MPFHVLSIIQQNLNIAYVLVQLLNEIPIINPLQTKRSPLYLKTQSVPRCKHF